MRGLDCDWLIGYNTLHHAFIQRVFINDLGYTANYYIIIIHKKKKRRMLNLSDLLQKNKQKKWFFFICVFSLFFFFFFFFSRRSAMRITCDLLKENLYSIIFFFVRYTKNKLFHMNYAPVEWDFQGVYKNWFHSAKEEQRKTPQPILSPNCSGSQLSS